jgi:hypothetical protein
MIKFREELPPGWDSNKPAHSPNEEVGISLGGHDRRHRRWLNRLRSGDRPRRLQLWPEPFFRSRPNRRRTCRD